MFLDQLNSRLSIQKKSKEVLSPLEKVTKAIQSDVLANSSYLVQKDWAKWNEEKAHNGVGGNEANPTAHKDSIPRGKRDESNHQKELNSDNWHTKTMAQHRDKSNDALRFIQRDAHDAERANPTGHKAGQYLDEMHYAGMELSARAKHDIKKQELIQKDWTSWNKEHGTSNSSRENYHLDASKTHSDLALGYKKSGDLKKSEAHSNASKAHTEAAKEYNSNKIKESENLNNFITRKPMVPVSSDNAMELSKAALAASAKTNG